jgi:adenosylmethionine-8-amino-7-oxononanoate aminotransferase
MTNEPTRTGDLSGADRRYLWHSLLQHRSLDSKPSMIIREGKGCTVTDESGREYLDAMAGLFCVNVGYGRHEIADAAAEQMRRLPFYPLSQSHPPAIRLAERLASMLPSGLERVYFCNSGSEAVETALKLARQYGRQVHRGQNRYKVIARYRGYHGLTMGALSATGQVMRRKAFEPLVPGFSHVDPPDRYRCRHCQAAPACTLACAEEIETRVRFEGPDTVAAIIAEPVIGGGGVIVSPDGYLPRLRETCDRWGILLILDEVITGFGRTGRLFGHQHWDVTPDIVTLAKGITSGYAPLGATVTTQAVFNAFLGELQEDVHFSQVSTFGGHPVACAAAGVNLDILLKERLWENAESVGDYLMGRLRAIRHPWIGEVRGKGLLIGVELVRDESKTPLADRDMASLATAIKEAGVIVGRNVETVPGFCNVLIVSPPLILSKAEADRIADAIETGLAAVSRKG